MHVKGTQSLKHAQILAGNILDVDSMKELKELITIPDNMYIYNL